MGSDSMILAAFLTGIEIEQKFILGNQLMIFGGLMMLLQTQIERWFVAVNIARGQRNTTAGSDRRITRVRFMRFNGS